MTVYEYDSMSGQLPVQISGDQRCGKGIGTVNVAVWTEEDQSDLQWMQAEQQEDGTFWMNIDVPEFNYKTGEYHIDVYLVDADGQPEYYQDYDRRCILKAGTAGGAYRAYTGFAEVYDIFMDNVPTKVGSVFGRAVGGIRDP